MVLHDTLKTKTIRQGWIRVVTQPAQSPDLNWLDLSIFNSLKQESHEIKGHAKTYEALQESVLNAFRDYDWKALERVYVLQFEVYREIIRNKGSNQYKMPHSGIRSRQNQGLEIADLSVDANEYLNALEALQVGLDDEVDEDEQVDV